MYTLKTLDNGIRVVMRKVPHLKSATIGIIANNGSFFENNINNGISHFIEHMLFKGTIHRTSREIAEAMDDIGGQVNAFTSKEHTCFYGKVIDEHLPIAIDVLGDMINNSLFDEEDMGKEKSVIMEEINMYQDFPEDLVFELLNELLYSGMSLSYPILGTVETVSNFNREQVVNYFKGKYTPDQIVISLVGSFEEEASYRLLNKHFGNFNKNSARTEVPPSYTYKPKKKIRGIYKDIEQFNLALGFDGPSTYSEDLFPMMALNNIIGGTMSSRLFQEIRENRGIVYSVESSISTYNGAGMFSIYAGLNKDHAIEVIQLIKKEIDDIKENLISMKELQKSKEHLKGSYILSLEGTFNQMYEMGKNILHGKAVDTPDLILKEIEGITMESVKRVIDRYLDWNHMNLAYVGPVTDMAGFNDSIDEILKYQEGNYVCKSC